MKARLVPSLLLSGILGTASASFSGTGAGSETGPGAAAATTQGGAAATRPSLFPKSWGGSLSFGWDSNLLQSGRTERRAFGTDNPNYLFVVDRIEGWQGSAEIWGRWDLPSFHKKMRMEIGYRRSQWPHVAILGYDRFDLGLRQKLSDGSQMDLTLRYEPQVYLRHRVDKDAPFGAPRFRPESYRGTEVGLAYARAVSGIKATVLAGYQVQDENRWFNERDEKMKAAGFSLQIPGGKGISFAPSYEFGRSRSRNKPLATSDRSYRQHATGLRAQSPLPLPGGPWGIIAASQWKFRAYTTNDPSDASRYHRHDRAYSWSVRVDRPAVRVTPFAIVEGAGRMVDLPAGAAANDEDGEYGDTVFLTGIEWQF